MAALKSPVVDRGRLRRRLLWAVPAVVVVYFAVTFVGVWMASGRDDPRTAGAIVVLGAAQYDGRPSPVLARRLDRAASLYEEGFSTTIVLTGGNQEGDRTTEAMAGYTYLRAVGIPDEHLLLEVDGTSTWESLRATERILAAKGIDDVLLVSDPYHNARLLAIADDLELVAHVAPTDGDVTLQALLRETAAVGVGRVIGHRRLLRFER